MRVLLLPLPYLVVFAHVTEALYPSKFCPSACELTLNYATFNDTDAWLSRKVRLCRSELRITSLYLCFEQFCEDDGEREKWIRDQGPWCDEHAGVTLPAFHDVVDRWTAHDRDGVKRMGVDEAMSFPVLGEVTIPNARFFDRAFTTMNVAFHQYDLHLIYGWYMYYFWAIVVGVGIGIRLLSLIRNLNFQNQKYLSISADDSRYRVKPHSILSLPKSWLKRFLTTPATFGDRCSQPYGMCTIPPRVQSLTIALFIALNVILCTRAYRLTDGNLYWPEKSAQLLRYVSDRTGIISLANFPLVWLFGMRNDMLLWMTGWSFGTYNAFHRWVARVAILQAVVHSLGYTVMILESGGWSDFVKYWRRHYFWNGELATIAMCTLLAFSFYRIRRAQYETFLITHIVLSIVALWSMYYHVEIFTKGEWNIFIWPCLIVWIFDRVLRAGRILAFNRQFWQTKATVSYNSASNLVRMDIDGSNNWIRPKPGMYYYIYILSDILYAHQNHPFTLAYVSSDSYNSTPIPLSSLPTRPSPYRHSSSESSESNALLTNASTSNLVFLIRPFDGFTSRLKLHCLFHPKKLRVLIEGPYGHIEPLYMFPNVLFVVGGTGIAVPLSHLARLLSVESQTQSLKIVWAVREHAFLVSFLQDFKGLLADERVGMEVHVTQNREVVDEVLDKDLKSVRIMTRRPDVHAAIQEAAREAAQQPLAVVACGPARMVDQARKTSVMMLAKGYRGVEYFEESSKW